MATTVISNVQVFDGREVVTADSVVLQDGVISGVGNGLGRDGAGVEVDGRGGTVLPGLIDAHTHTLAVPELEQALAFGVTTELDMFCTPNLLGPLRAAAAARDDVADLRSAGIGATAPGGHPTQLVGWGVYPEFPTVAGPGDAAGFVADRVAEGSDYLKILIEDGACFGGSQPRMDAATVTALVAAARERGLRAVAHVSTAGDADEAMAAGVDGLAHLFVDREPDPGFGRRAAAAGVFVVPTLTIFEVSYGTGRRESAYLDHPRLWPYLDPQMQRALQTDWREHTSLRPPEWASARHAHHATRLAREAGVAVLAGTDAAGPRAAHGLSLHAELAALVDAGLSPAEALAAATSGPAEQFGLADRGRITPGRRADLLLVDGDPTRDITATDEITAVWRRGQRLDRESYQAQLHAHT